MLKELNTPSARVGRIKELYEAARDAYAPALEEYERNLRQYLGTDEIDGSPERASTVRNITYELIESEISPNVPYPKVEGRTYSEAGAKAARSIERLCAFVREALPFEELNDADERYAYVYGGSVFYAEWDSATGTGGPRIRVLPPADLIPQPGISEVSDMDYLFLRFTTTKGEITGNPLYGRVSEEELSRLDYEFEYELDPDSDAVTLIVCFYREDGEIGKYVFSGDCELLYAPSYYGRAAAEASCGFPVVIRRNTRATADLLGCSDCRLLRPIQQAINKVESRILQKLLRAGITPILPEGAAITPSSSVFGQVIRMRPGETVDSYGKLDTTPDISRDVEEADRLYDQAKRLIGITDALQGYDEVKNESGYAKQLRLQRGEARLEGKRRLKNRAYAELYRLIYRLYLIYSGESIPLTYKDAFGNVCKECFSPQDIKAAEELDRHLGECFIFSVDENGGESYTREALWQRNLENLTSGSLGSKDDPETLLRYWQNQERAHYPFARENAEYFRQLTEGRRAKEKEIDEKEKNDEKE